MVSPEFQRINLYAYVVNNPFRYIDPLGLWEIDLKTSEDFMFDVEVGVLIKDWEIYPYVGDYSVNLNDLLLPDLKGAGRIADEVVRREAPETGLPGAWNGPQDAWRHARWNQRMVEELGWGTAIIAGYGHELEEIFSQPWNEFFMDLHNNREGRGIANTGKTPMDLFNEGRLRTINPLFFGKGELY